MNITLSSQQTHSLAGEFAATIHARVISKHLDMVDEAHRRLTLKYPFNGGYADMQAAIRSITDPRERKDFVFTIGFLFKRLREEKGTDIRGRDYVARVRAFEAAERERHAQPWPRTATGVRNQTMEVAA